MTASFEHLQGLYYRLTERIPAADAAGVFDREVRRQSKSSESTAQAKQRLGDSAWQQALATARDAAYQNALQKSELRPVSAAQFDWLQCDAGQDCVFTATVEVLPAIDLGGLDAIEIERPSIAISDDDVARAVELVRSEHKTFQAVARPAQVGDRVRFGFEGSLGGDAFEGSSQEQATAVLGAGDVLDDMEVALIGRVVDDRYDALVTFPDDYAKPALRGETATFHIAIHEVAAPEFPALDAPFVKRLGVESGSLDELRDQLRQRLTDEAERARHRYERRQLTAALLEAVPVTVPQTLFDHELERVRSTVQEGEPNAEGDSADAQAQPPEQPLRATAERRVALSLILSEFIRQHDIRLDIKRVEQKLDELAAGFALADPAATKRQYRQDTQVMHNVQALVIEEQGFEAVLDTVDKTPVTMSLDALLQAPE